MFVPLGGDFPAVHSPPSGVFGEEGAGILDGAEQRAPLAVGMVPDGGDEDDDSDDGEVDMRGMMMGTPPVPHLSAAEKREIERESRRKEKIEKEKMLFKLYALRKKGATPSKRYTIESNLDDMRDEYRILKHNVDMRASRAFSGKMLVMIVTAIEFLNERFDPFDLYLDGWSESIHENIGDYDEVFDQLYEKYKERMSVAPEVKLLLMLGGSAFMFHMTNSMFRPTSVPGVNNLPQAAVQKMMAAAQREVAPSVPVSSSASQRVGFSQVSGGGGGGGGGRAAAAAPPPPARRRSPATPDATRPLVNAGGRSSPNPEGEAVADILNYIATNPQPRSSRDALAKDGGASTPRSTPGIAEFLSQRPATPVSAGPGDDARSESTLVSVVTTGGTRRRQSRKKKRVMTINL